MQLQQILEFLISYSQSPGRLLEEYPALNILLLNSLIFRLNLDEETVEIIKQIVQEFSTPDNDCQKDIYVFQISTFICRYYSSQSNIEWFSSIVNNYNSFVLSIDPNHILEQNSQLSSSTNEEEDNNDILDTVFDYNTLLNSIAKVLIPFLFEFRSQTPEIIFELINTILHFASSNIENNIKLILNLIKIYTVLNHYSSIPFPQPLIEICNKIQNIQNVVEVLKINPSIIHFESLEETIASHVNELTQNEWDPYLSPYLIDFLSSLVTSETLSFYEFMLSIHETISPIHLLSFFPLITSLLIHGKEGLEPLIDFILSNVEVDLILEDRYKFDNIIVTGIKFNTLQPEKIAEYISLYIERGAENQILFSFTFDLLGLVFIHNIQGPFVPLVEHCFEIFSQIEDPISNLLISYNFFIISSFRHIEQITPQLLLESLHSSAYFADYVSDIILKLTEIISLDNSDLTLAVTQFIAYALSEESFEISFEYNSLSSFTLENIDSMFGLLINLGTNESLRNLIINSLQNNAIKNLFLRLLSSENTSEE